MKKSTGISHSFHTSIVLRSALIVMLVSGLVGYGLLGLITKYVEPKVQQTLTDRLVELVKTVENTARIACYLGDPSLAGEVAKGLLMNRDVERVLIISDQGTLADFSRATSQQDTHSPTSAGVKSTPPDFTLGKAAPNVTIPPNAIVRTLVSPFKANTNVGKIAVIRNDDEIKTQVEEEIAFIRLLIILQTTAIIIVVTAIAVGYIAHPIHQISKRLNELSAVDGEKIEIPLGHNKNEIGQLVDGVNFLIDKLVSGIMTERNLRMEREIEEKRFRAIFENAETGIFVIDKRGQLKSFNPSFRNTMGLGEKTGPQNEVSISLLEILGDQASRVQLLIDSSLQEKRTKTEEVMLLSSEGNPRWVNMILNPVEDNLIQGVINDITENKMREAYANKLALTDALTGLGNRLGFERQIETLINERHANPDSNFTMMMIDLDRFKQVNDTHGHDVGDAILVHVARNIEQSIRKADFAARLGGDEFVVLLPFVTDETIVARLAHILIRNISQPIVTKTGIQTSVGASIGITLVKGPDMKKEQVIKQADLALYEVKQSGRNAFRIYNSQNNDAANSTKIT